jgi:hypothetical protein
MRKLMGFAVLVVALTAPPNAAVALAQDARLTERLDAATRDSVWQLVEGARADKLPTEPLIQKALEGSSRAAAPAQIVRAVRGLRNRLSVARSALGPSAGDAELVAGAGAIYLGVPSAALTRLRREQSTGSLALPLVALADMIERGVPSDTAVTVVTTLAEAGVGDDAYAQLRHAMAEDIRAGASPAAAAQARAEGILVSRPSRTRRSTGPPR